MEKERASEKSGGAVLRAAFDTLHGLDRCLLGRASNLAWVFAGLGFGWWVYVPIHEFLHAAACRLTGGQVTELQIAPLYGGDLWAALFPWVTSGGDYAGRLVGFDTFGNDGIYLATDFGPFVLTLWPGVWALRRAAAASRPMLFGASLPMGLAPFMSLTGDAFEIGTILTTRLAPWSAYAETLRSDDLLLWVETHWQTAGAPWGGAALALLLGIIWALGTYAAGGLVASALGAGPVPPLGTAEVAALRAERSKNHTHAGGRSTGDPPPAATPGEDTR